MCEHFILQNGSNFQLVCGENCHLLWSRVFNVKIATFEVLHVKIAMIGGWLVCWLVDWLVVGTPKLLRTSFSCQSLFKRTDMSKCKHFESVLPLQLLWFVGNMCLGLVKHASQAKHLVLLVLVGESRGGQRKNNIDCVRAAQISLGQFLHFLIESKPMWGQLK